MKLPQLKLRPWRVNRHLGITLSGATVCNCARSVLRLRQTLHLSTSGVQVALLQYEFAVAVPSC